MPEVDRPCWGKISLKYLVYEKDDCFIVFVDDDNDVDWQASDDYVQANEAEFKASLAVVNSAANLEGMPCRNLEDRDVLTFKRLVGEAIARALAFTPAHC